MSWPTTLLSSSVVERSAVNRLVVGSNPTSGAILPEFQRKDLCSQLSGVRLRLSTLSNASTARNANSAAAFTSAMLGCNCRKYCQARSSYLLESDSSSMPASISKNRPQVKSVPAYFMRRSTAPKARKGNKEITCAAASAALSSVVYFLSVFWEILAIRSLTAKAGAEQA